MHECEYVGAGIRLQAFVACDLILYLLLLKEKEDDFEPGCL